MSKYKGVLNKLRRKKLKEIILCNCKIGPAGALELSKLIDSKLQLTVINLAINYIGDEGARNLAEAIKDSATLNSLQLNGNRIGPIGVRHIVAAVSNMPSIVVLNLNDNDIGAEGSQHLAELIKTNNSLNTLNLGYNDIGAEGTHYIADALKYNSGLTTLDLHANNIGNQGAQYIAIGIRYNSTLAALNLHLNNITDEGAKQLLLAVQHNISLSLVHLESAYQTSNIINKEILSKIEEELAINNNPVTREQKKERIGAAHVPITKTIPQSGPYYPLKELLMDNLFGDLDIAPNNPESIKIHRFICATRCPKLLEQNPNSIFDTLPQSVLKSFAWYLYTDSIVSLGEGFLDIEQLGVDDIFLLWKVAKSLSMIRLEQLIRMSIRKSTNKHNAMDLAVAAFRHELKSELNECRQLIKKDSREFKGLQLLYPDISAKLMSEDIPSYKVTGIPESTFVIDMKNAITLYRDIDLVVEDCDGQRKTIQTHKAVLSHCSEYFKSLFTNTTTAVVEHKCPIPLGALEAMITCFYKGRITSKPKLCFIIAIADAFYRIDSTILSKAIDSAKNLNESQLEDIIIGLDSQLLKWLREDSELLTLLNDKLLKQVEKRLQKDLDGNDQMEWRQKDSKYEEKIMVLEKKVIELEEKLKDVELLKKKNEELESTVKEIQSQLLTVINRS
eukprot:TRINITY_DN7247_c0_g1_i1.p1 TRINITY_DN7247_c0_g1~~TRINITY_DN7247_c0_g1_i1.p1  ORF type:complete len:684 (+),score=116.73 TRINITY_DN7247_c0_g1_i1:31-2052(+)